MQVYGEMLRRSSQWSYRTHFFTSIYRGIGREERKLKPIWVRMRTDFNRESVGYSFVEVARKLFNAESVDDWHAISKIHLFALKEDDTMNSVFLHQSCSMQTMQMRFNVCPFNLFLIQLFLFREEILGKYLIFIFFFLFNIIFAVYIFIYIVSIPLCFKLIYLK